MENTSSSRKSSRIPRFFTTLVILGTGIVVIGLIFSLFGLWQGFSPLRGKYVVATAGVAFHEEEIRLPAGTEITLELRNDDILAHSFDIDELDLHLAMPAKENITTTISSIEPGSYTFYCAIYGHRAAGMVGTLIIE